MPACNTNGDFAIYLENHSSWKAVKRALNCSLFDLYDVKWLQLTYWKCSNCSGNIVEKSDVLYVVFHSMISQKEGLCQVEENQSMLTHAI